MPLQRAKLRTVSFSSSRFPLLLSFCYIYCCYCCGLCRHNVTKYFVPYQKADALWTCTHTNDIHTVTKIAPPNGHQHSTAAPRIYFYVRPDGGTGRDVKDRTRREKDSNNKQDLAATAWPQLAFLCFCFLFFFSSRDFSHYARSDMLLMLIRTGATTGCVGTHTVTYVSELLFTVGGWKTKKQNDYSKTGAK